MPEYFYPDKKYEINMNQEIRILLVDDEPDILEFLKYYLQKEKFKVFTANNGREGITIAKQKLPHLIMLDIMMPELDGIETCRQLREIKELKDSLIVYLTARNEEFSEIAGFDAGADDYITKPIKPRVLLSRLKAILRRFSRDEEKIKVISLGDITIDREKYMVTKNGTGISLPKKEFELLSMLATKPGRVFTRDEIMNQVWGSDVIVGDRTIDVHIRKVREKLGEDYIKTIKGIGYKFNL